jgi:hypothetical protein
LDSGLEDVTYLSEQLDLFGRVNVGLVMKASVIVHVFSRAVITRWQLTTRKSSLAQHFDWR